MNAQERLTALHDEYQKLTGQRAYSGIEKASPADIRVHCNEHPLTIGWPDSVALMTQLVITARAESERLRAELERGI